MCVRARARVRIKCSSISCQKRVCSRCLRSRCRECLVATKILYWRKLYNDLTYVLPGSCQSLDQIHRLKRTGHVSRKIVVWTALIVLVGKFYVNKTLEMLSRREYHEINRCYLTRVGLFVSVCFLLAGILYTILVSYMMDNITSSWATISLLRVFSPPVKCVTCIICE